MTTLAALNLVESHADYLLGKADYMLGGAQGMTDSRGTTTLYNQGQGRHWGASTIKGTNPAACWAPQLIGHTGPEMPKVFAGAAKGTIVMLAHLTTAVRRPFFSAAQNGGGTAACELLHNSADLVFTANDGGGAETITATNAYVNATWVLYACEWGPLGKRIYADGVLKASDGSKVDGVGATMDTPCLGREYVLAYVYSTLKVALFAYWPEQLGEAAHRTLQAARRAT